MGEKDKQEQAFEEALDVIENGCSYYTSQIEVLRSRLGKLRAGIGDSVKKLSREERDEKIESYEEEIAYLRKKNIEFTEKRKDIKSKYHGYNENAKKEGNMYLGDENQLCNLLSARGIDGKDARKDKILSTFRKEHAKLTADVQSSLEKLDKSLQENQDYIVDSSGGKVLRRPGVLDADSFKQMAVRKNEKIEKNIPKEQSEQDLDNEKNAILESIEGYRQIQEVSNIENDFNISYDMMKSMEKCSALYEEIAKHKQIISKISAVLQRFEVSDTDIRESNGKLKNRSKEYKKTCKLLHKLKEKEEKRIEKLQKKVKKPMEKNNISELCNLANDRKIVDSLQKDTSNLSIEISGKESQIEALIARKSEIEKGLDLSEELPSINQKISELRNSIKKDKDELKEKQSKLEDAQERKSAAEHDGKMKKYIEKAPVKVENIPEQNNFSKELGNQVVEEPNPSEVNEVNSRSKSKDEMNIEDI